MSVELVASAAAGAYLGGLLLLLGFRDWRHRASTGTTGIRLLSPTSTRAARLAAALMAAAVVCGLASPFLVWASALPLLAEFDRLLGLVLPGLLIAVVGFGLAAQGQRAMGPSWRIGVDERERTELVTAGLFSRVRNPIFTGMVLAQLGTALMAPTWLSAASVVLLVLGVELQVRRVEEPYLLRTHGDRYRRYAQQIGRFVPYVGRLIASESGPPAVPRSKGRR